MIEEQVLRCSTCQREVRIVRLTPASIALGHVANPRQNHHRVTLARAAADRSNAIAATVEDIQPQLGERDNTRRGGANLRERAVPAVAPRSPSKPPAEAASNADPSRTPRLPLGLGAR